MSFLVMMYFLVLTFSRCSDAAGDVRAFYKESVTFTKNLKGDMGSSRGLSVLNTIPSSLPGLLSVKHSFDTSSDQYLGVKEGFAFMDAAEISWWAGFFSSKAFSYVLGAQRADGLFAASASVSVTRLNAHRRAAVITINANFHVLRFPEDPWALPADLLFTVEEQTKPDAIKITKSALPVIIISNTSRNRSSIQAAELDAAEEKASAPAPRRRRRRAAAVVEPEQEVREAEQKEEKDPVAQQDAERSDLRQQQQRDEGKRVSRPSARLQEQSPSSSASSSLSSSLARMSSSSSSSVASIPYSDQQQHWNGPFPATGPLLCLVCRISLLNRRSEIPRHLHSYHKGIKISEANQAALDLRPCDNCGCYIFRSKPKCPFCKHVHDG